MAHSDPEQFVRDSVAAGMPLQRVAALLRAEGVPPMDAVKAIRNGAGIYLGDAKFLVDATLPPEWQAENEKLREAAEQALIEPDG